MRSTAFILATVLLALAGCAANPPAVTPAENAPRVYAVPVYVVPNCTDVAGRCYWIEPRGGQVVQQPPQPKRVPGIAL